MRKGLIVVLAMIIGLIGLQSAYAQSYPAASMPARETKNWNYEMAGDIAGKSGNVEKSAFGGHLKADYMRAQHTLKLYIMGSVAKEEGDKTAEEILAGADYENQFKERQSWYLRNEYEYDRIEGIDMRATIAGGYGYYFIQKEDRTLRGRIGLQYRHESYDGGRIEKLAGIDAGLRHWMPLNEWAEMTNEVTYNPAFEDFSNYLARHESKIDVKLGDSENWKMSAGLLNDYNSQPSEDKRKLDTEYFLKLIFAWK